jgi:hypothetical protein
MDNITIYDILIVIYFIIVIIGIIKGSGKNRTIIIFQDYDDLGLSFLVPSSFILIQLIFSMLGVNTTISNIVAWLVSGFLLIKLIINTYYINNRNFFKTILALLTKIPLAVIWIVNLEEALNPSGKGHQRVKNRGRALAILTFLTPIINLLVVDKTGKFFNPRGWIKGRRVGNSIRNNL